MENEKALALRPEWAVSNFDGLLRLSGELIKTGFLPQAVNTPQKAVAIILTGKELGIPTMLALRQINVINGKPTVPPELMLALAYQRIPGFSATVIKSDASICTMKFKRGDTVLDTSFTIEDATRMGLAGKDNWLKQPATMLRWRCISQGLRLIAPDVICGVYTQEEMNPDLPMDEDGPRPANVQRPVAAPRMAISEATEKPKVRVVPNVEESPPMEQWDDVPYPETPPPPQSATSSPVVPLVQEPDIVEEAAEIFKPEKIIKPKAEKKAPKKPQATLKVSAEQIDVLGGYMIREELKQAGFRWNTGLNAWSKPFDEETLEFVKQLIGVE